jgi:hypothetical protein
MDLFTTCATDKPMSEILIADSITKIQEDTKSIFIKSTNSVKIA